MNVNALALQTGLFGWIGGHWAGLLGGVVFLGMVYFVAALVLDLPLPFDQGREDRKEGKRR